MKMADSKKSVKYRAAEALKTALHQVSQIKLKSIEFDSPRPDLKVDILAYVDVHGKNHTLVCKVGSSSQPEHVRVALKELQALEFSEEATPVVIAPYFSEESEALCRESKAGFLDLEGNAQLELGEVFIRKRCLAPERSRSVSSETGRDGEEQLAASRFGPNQVAAPPRAQELRA
jgi:hypothetical protein